MVVCDAFACAVKKVEERKAGRAARKIVFIVGDMVWL